MHNRTGKVKNFDYVKVNIPTIRKKTHMKTAKNKQTKNSSGTVFVINNPVRLVYCYNTSYGVRVYCHSRSQTYLIALRAHTSSVAAITSERFSFSGKYRTSTEKNT